MRKIERIPEVMNLVEEAWKLFPDMRFWQFMGWCLGEIANEFNTGDMFFIEEPEWKKMFQWFIDKYSHKE